MSSGHDRYELAVFSARGLATHVLGPGVQLVVGRGEGADIVVDDAAVSRRHAIFHGGPPAEIEDLGSSNGTYLSPAGSKPTGGASGDQTADHRRVAVRDGRLAVGLGDTFHFGAALVVVRAIKASGAPGQGVARDAMAALKEEAARAAKLLLPVLILGETGAGKDVLARFIHEQSPRAKRPFVALNCAALSESLAESELFGHEKGAYTGAHGARAGLFESAHGGTVFLDEIGELPLALQAKLLRTLESSEITRVGSTRSIKVDVRFLSATNRDLEKSSVSGAFRRDLYFRLNGIALHVPPLRTRKREIADLARLFLAAAAKQAGRDVPVLSPDALVLLEGHAWPGNVRELRFAMERTLVTAGDGPILPQHLPPQIAGSSTGSPPRSASTESATRERVIDALAECDGNQTRAAELLGVSRRTLINRMIDFDLPRPRKG